MIRLTALCVALTSMLGCSALNGTKSELVGVWKSDAERTLKSMRSVEGVSCEAKRLFEDDFFGHLIAEYTERKSRFYFDREEDNVEGMKDFYPYKLVKETPEKFVVRYFDELADEEVTKELRREGNCYWLPVSKWEFREYFCRVE